MNMQKSTEEENKKKWIKYLLLLLLLIVAIFAIIGINQKNKKLIEGPKANKEILKMFLNGEEEEQIIQYGSNYLELGAVAWYDNQNVSNSIMIDKSELDLNKVGTYRIKYIIKIDGEEKIVERTVRVVDTKAPILSLKGNNEITLPQGSVYTELGAIAIDNYDGDISNKVTYTIVGVGALGNSFTNKVGTYTITYTVTDSSGNTTAVERIVHVVKVEATVGTTTITLKGTATVYLEYPANYYEAGYSAIDTKDGDITGKVKTTIVGVGALSDPFTKKRGTYTLTYSVTNSDGKVAKTTRTIIVQDTVKPEIILNGNAYVSVGLGETYTELGATAVDNYDGNITDKIVIKGAINTDTIGKQYMNYEITDSSGNKTTIQRTVEVKDLTKPVLTIDSAKANVTIERGTSYNILDGVTVWDNYDGDITDKITYTIAGVGTLGNLFTNKVGIYVVTYSVKDGSGNIADSVIKTITVEDTTPPTGLVTYSTTVPTNAPVIVTITANEDIVIDDPSWTVIGNVATKSYVSNITDEIVIVKDLTGNTSTATITIDNIDTSAVIGTATYSPSTVTNGNVNVTITTNKEIEIPTGWTRISSTTYQKTYTANVAETITIKDLSRKHCCSGSECS